MTLTVKLAKMLIAACRVRARAKVSFVYKIPYRRARAWPSGRVRARVKVSCIQRYLAYKTEALFCNLVLS